MEKICLVICLIMANILIPIGIIGLPLMLSIDKIFKLVKKSKYKEIAKRFEFDLEMGVFKGIKSYEKRDDIVYRNELYLFDLKELSDTKIFMEILPYLRYEKSFNDNSDLKNYKFFKRIVFNKTTKRYWFCSLNMDEIYNSDLKNCKFDKHNWTLSTMEINEYFRLLNELDKASITVPEYFKIDDNEWRLLFNECKNKVTKLFSK